MWGIWEKREERSEVFWRGLAKRARSPLEEQWVLELDDLFGEALSSQKGGLAAHRFPWNQGEVERALGGYHTPAWLHTHAHMLSPKICTQNPDVNCRARLQEYAPILKAHSSVWRNSIAGGTSFGWVTQPCDVVMEYSVSSVMFPMTIQKLENITDEHEHLAHKNNKMMTGWETFVDMFLSLQVIFPWLGNKRFWSQLLHPLL